MDKFKGYFDDEESGLPRGELAKKLSKDIKTNTPTERVWAENKRKIAETKKYKLNKIKFSKEYPKLWGQCRAELIAVKNISNKIFPFNDWLIEYDTKAEDGSYYKLAKGEYLQLIFLGNRGIPFCTIRRRTPEKEKYYENLVGESFEIAREF